MKKKTVGKLLGGILAAAMVMGSLAGCGGGGGQSSADSGDAAADTGSQGSEDTADAGDSDGVETFTIATVRWTDAWPNDFMNQGIMKELEDKHNIKINWQVYYNSDWTEQKSLLLASGDPNNEIPYTNAGSLSGDLSNLLAPFGTIVSRTGNFMQIDESGNPAYVPVTDHFKEATKWAHELYASGCLDQEYFTQDTSMATAKRQAEGGSQTGLVFAWTADAEMGANAEQFELCEAVAGPDGKRYVESDPTYLDIANRELVITTQCKNPDKLLQWADDFYTDLVSLQTYYGSIPDQIQENEDGTYEVLIPADGTTLDTSAWSFSMRDFGPKYMTEEFQSKVILPESQGDGVKLAQDAVNAPHASDIAFPVVSYTADQLTRLASLTTDINNYASSQYAHWVVDGGIDEEWDAYLDQLNQMGLQEVLEIHNDAYAAYKAIVD